MTRAQIINLITQYIYTNGNENITAAQLNEILIEMANAFAMEGSGGAEGIDAVLAAGSNVAAGRKITNNDDGAVLLSASIAIKDYTYQYIGIESSDDEHENVNYVGDILTLSGSAKRSDPTRNIVEMMLAESLEEGEYVAAIASMAQSYEGLENGIVSITRDENGRVIQFQHADRTETKVEERNAGGDIEIIRESSHTQTINSIKNAIQNGEDLTYYLQGSSTIEFHVSGTKGGTSTVNVDPAKIVSKVERGTVTDSVHIMPTGKVGVGGTGITSRDNTTNEQSSTMFSPQNIMTRVNDTDEGLNGTTVLQTFKGTVSTASVGDQHAYLDIDPSGVREGTRLYARDSTTSEESYVAVEPSSLSLVVDGGDLESGITQTAASISVEASSINLIGELNFMRAGKAVWMADGEGPVFEIDHGMTDPISMSVTFGDESIEAIAGSKKELTATKIKITCTSDPVGEIVVYWQVFK